MTKTDYYSISEIHDELVAQNKKLDKMAEQLEAQTRLQEGIFKQLYLLCQISATSSDMMKASFGGDSLKVFINTPIQGEKSNEN